MKNNILSLAFISILFLATSCSKDKLIGTPAHENPVVDPISKLSFDLQKRNLGDSTLHTVITSKVIDRFSSWHEESEGKVHIYRSIIFNDSIKNNEQLNIEILLHKYEEDRSMLFLKDLDKKEYSQRMWDYIDHSAEKDSFYKGFGSLSITFNSRYTIGFSNLKVLKTYKALVNGIEKTGVQFSFEGNANGFYDQQGLYGGYSISNGEFYGVIE